MPGAAAVRPSSSSSPTGPAPASQHVREQRMDNNVPVSRDPRHRSRRRRKRENWVPASASGNLLYRPQISSEKLSEAKASPALPAPRIAPRRNRPHSIHILSLPPGYVPRELRLKAPSFRNSDHATTKPRLASLSSCFGTDLPLRLLISRIIASLSGKPLSAADLATTLSPASLQALAVTDDDHPPRPPSSTARRRRNSLHHRRQHSAAPAHPDRPGDPRSRQPRRNSRDLERRDRTKEREKSRENSRKRNTLRDPSRDPDRDHNGPKRRASDRVKDRAKDRPRDATKDKDRDRHNRQLPPSSHPPSDRRHQHQQQQQHHTQQQHHNHHHHHTPAAQHCTPVANRATSTERMSTNYQLFSPRQSFTSVHQVKFPITNVTEIQKPVATGSGVACSIILAERQLFLSGFDHDGRGRPDGQAGTALLRGRLQLNVSKNVKVKAIQLKLVGRARTEWPEGIPPLKQDVFEEESLRTQVLTFFSALNGNWETAYGNQCTFRHASDSTNLSASSLGAHGHPSHHGHLTAKEMKLLSLRHVRARSFGKGESRGLLTHAKGHKVFPPGTYDYSFELPIDHHQLETTKVPYGSVRWELHATIDRAGAFKPNLHGTKELPIVRLPDQLSLEMSEPISISRRWEDQLHYEIMVSGKSFPIGSRIPIAFKLTPLAKVRVHKIKIYISEVIEYWTNDRRVTRKDPGRKVLLLEKNAGKSLDSAWDQSELTTLRGGELTAEQRLEYRDQATRRNYREAHRNHAATVETFGPQPENLLGDLELGLENLWGATEMEANVQIPTCEMMAKDKELKLHPDCSWKNVSVFHWIKVVMRISRLDADDALKTRRRHFEISIDSPLTILDCRATQSNTILPAYSLPTSHPGPFQHTCGCPDAPIIQTESSPNSSAGELLPAGNPLDASIPVAPPTAHMNNHVVATPRTMAEGIPRPIHLLRAPSFNPPAFNDDVTPPALSDDAASVMTPPPQYDAVVGTPSVDGLADYFSRLANWQPIHDEDSEDEDHRAPRRLTERSGRVNVAHPRTPGGRRISSRSLELARPSADLGLGNLHISRGVAGRRGVI